MVEDGSIDVLRILSNAAAVITEGEVLQLSIQSKLETTLDQYLEVIAAKTYMNSGIKSTKEYRKGYQDALAYIKERDYELIKQSPPVYEKEFTIYRDDALDLAENMLPEEQLVNPFKKFVDDTLFKCSHAEPLSSIVVKVLNNWVLVEDTNDIYNIAKLPNLNVTFEDHLTRALLRDQFNTFKRTGLAI